nr:hypothetical protein [Candidatus Aminicenantes bacterium]
PYQIKRFKKEFPRLEIEASVIMNLDTYTKIEKILSGGVNVVNIPLDLNRNAKELGKIAGLKRRYPRFRIKLLANHICFYGCPFTQFHYFLSEVKEVFKPKEGRSQDFERCVFYPFNLEDLEELISRPFIRPEDISFYKEKGYADIFKLCFRTNETPVLRKTVFSYLKESYDGNLLDIITNHGKPLRLYWDNKRFPQGFIEKVTGCDKSRCKECKYCRGVSKKVFGKI